ncbi:hypothetical protein NPX13_g112 [Xylaria arbuscula]|uniref:Uncharacterized protein n=1 Tax=Xylaria arbuscula TaxID=114810 RepID=A0A9W8NNG8_9PEZI|nr:hypothetical protein NPX13_g112 [Xylaria arbuscula]
MPVEDTSARPRLGAGNNLCMDLGDVVDKPIPWPFKETADFHKHEGMKIEAMRDAYVLCHFDRPAALRVLSNNGVENDEDAKQALEEACKTARGIKLRELTAPREEQDALSLQPAGGKRASESPLTSTPKRLKAEASIPTSTPTISASTPAGSTDLTTQAPYCEPSSAPSQGASASAPSRQH